MSSMLRLLLLPALVLLAPHARAEIYRYYDESGNLVLSDKVPKERAEQVRKVKPREIMTVPGLKATQVKKPAASQAVVDGYAIVVVSPAKGSTYARGAAPIPVGVSVAPSLGSGHRMEFLLDGKARSALEEISTADLKPGRHLLAVRILDTRDKVLKLAEVEFQVR